MINRQRGGSQEAVREEQESDNGTGDDDSEASSDENLSDDEEKDQQRFSVQLDGSLRRRGQRRGLLSSRLSDGLDCNYQIDSNNDKEKRRRLWAKLFTDSLNNLEEISVRVPQRFCTALLITSMIIWLGIDIIERRAAKRTVASFQAQASLVSKPTVDLVKLRMQREHEAKLALGSAAATLANMGDQNLEANNDPARGKVDIEALSPGCVPSEWQTKSFPNCNEIHEIDLYDALGPSLRKGRTNETLAYSDVGYVGSGLWRSVWKIHPHGPMLLSDGSLIKPVVLKTMRLDHKVSSRNLDRHRRDALVMERLTSSPNVIDIYGFCGNTILSEFLKTTVDRIIYEGDDDYPSNKTLASRETPLGRLRLALDVSKGVAALHSIDGGPIIHADLQAKQFLVDTDGTVKVNDFNRCRFMAHNNETNQPCAVRIPQAPGDSRAPEEYDFKPLNEQIDVYSLGHVLFTILTGQDSFGEIEGDRREAVKEGKKPVIEPNFREEGSSDFDLANLILRAYEHDPSKRITSPKLVQELETLLRKYETSRL